MAIEVQVQSTSSVMTTGIKLLVYGQAGSGKTTMIKTLPNPIILSAEGGLLSLKDSDLPFIKVGSMSELRDSYLWLVDNGGKYQSVAIDSISEIAEVVLNHEKKVAKDPRQAYGAMQEQMTDLIRAFRDLPMNVYMTAKLEKMTDETGKVMYSPSMPGIKTGQQLPYFFDELLALRVEKDSEGNIWHGLKCRGDSAWQAKDRSGKLEEWEEPNLSKIIAKIGGA
jgi:phage nucleotide-binding protein